MRWLTRWLAELPAYLWSGWGAIASLLLGIGLWELIAGIYGPLILPTPLEAGQTLRDLAAPGGPLLAQLAITAWRAFLGLALAVGVGSLLGVAAGVSVTASVLARPWGARGPGLGGGPRRGWVPGGCAADSLAGAGHAVVWHG